MVVDDRMRTSDPAIFAVGECAEHRGMSTAWSRRSGRCAGPADALTGDETAAYERRDAPTRLKVSGVDVFSAGNFAGGEGCEDIVFRDAGARRLQARGAARTASPARCCSAMRPTAAGTST